MLARLCEISLILNKLKEQILHSRGHKYTKNNISESKLKLLQYIQPTIRPIWASNSNRDNARYVHDNLIDEKLELDS